ncbi:uncharacterized protein TNCV_3962451 [Trichonephila clavipes]|nr:uncharacterized protein TNCV_3962451 [Trichonephila clavipes]
MRPTGRALDTSDVEGLIDVKFVEAQSCWQDGEKRGKLRSTVKSLNDVRSQVKSAYQSNSVITDIDVTFDGTWLTRGHSSQISVGCVIDLLTGFVMDFEIMSKRCIECEHANLVWEKIQQNFMCGMKDISSCAINHVGSSCAMEQEAALKLCQRSEDSGFRYKTLLSDGDAKTSIFKY